MPRRKARGYGRGSIKTTAEGRQRAKLRLAGVDHDRTFDTYADAEEWLDDLLDGIERADDMRLAEWLERWSRDYVRAGRGTKATQENRAYAISKLAPLGAKKLSAVSPDDVTDLLRALSIEDGHAANTVKRVRGTLSAAYKVAVAQGRCKRNPCETVQTPAEARAKKARRSLTVAQRADLLDNAHGSPWLAALWLGCTMALRPQEIRALRWSDVDLDGAVLSVVAQPKTPQSARKLKLPDSGVALLRAHKTAQTAARLKSQPGAWRDTGLVVTTRVGTAVHPRNLRRIVENACTAAGIFPAIVPYELRHTALTILRESGAPLGALRQLAGHKDLRMLSQDYYHDTLDVADAVVEYDRDEEAENG